MIKICEAGLYNYEIKYAGQWELLNGDGADLVRLKTMTDG